MATRLMIVDDSSVIRNRIARLVADSRLADVEICGLAGDGLRALDLARELKPDLVTMDLTMPEMDGEACIEALVLQLPEVRILVVSALADRTTALRAVMKGAHGFVLKPFRDEELLNALLELKV
ncbi:response regulator transcription factor [Propionivibrio sp.]|uniref:response regulator transcription factor n=1 Tax=Propionivibrio sp. TaxID=2212460 RepID=UPI003BF2E3C4